MRRGYGVWTSSLDVCGNPQLSTFWRRRLQMLVPVSQTSPVLSRRSLLWLGAAMLLTLLPPTLCQTAASADEEKKPAALVYQIEPKSPGGQVTAADVETLLTIVAKRLDAGSEKLGTVRKLGDRRIEVTLKQPDEANYQRVKRLLARPGTLEFRILANTWHDEDLIARAKKDQAKDEVLDASGKRLAWWVPVREAEARALASYVNRDSAVRTKKKDGREITEVLVVPDARNVTGEYLTRVEAAKDQAGRPTVRFTFSNAGGELFAKLTGEHLPNEDAREKNHKLAIILDGEVFSAPAIMSTIRNSGEITGSFTESEVTDLVNTLNAGSLPVRLRLIARP
jgi:preprotein translocase subunit SecD